MKKSLVVLSILTGLLALVQSAVGLFTQGGSGPFNFTTLHGETVQMWGRGIYFYDTYFKAPIFRGTDAVTLFLVLPLLAVAIGWYLRRGSLRAQLFLAGILSSLVYDSASVVLGTAYNNLFLEYIAYFGASVFALGLALASIDLQELASRISAKLPRRGMAVLLVVAGAAVLFAWLSDIINWMQPGAVPGITSYTTEVTYAIDLALIAPLCFLTAVLILRRAAAGYLTGAILLILLTVIGVVVSVQTVFQLGAGIALAPGVIVGKTASFAILALFALWLVIRLIRSVSSLPLKGGVS